MAEAPVRTLIVEDEPLGREGLRMLLSADPEVALCGEAQGGRQAVELIRAHQPDLLFLDVQMPELDGFAVLRSLRPAPPPKAVIFVTAYDRYALRAFEVHAIDYLLKPFDDERFHEALRRAKDHLRLHRVSALSQRLLSLLQDLEVPPAPAPAYLQRLSIRDGGRVLFLPVAEIDWIEAADYYAQIHAGGREYLHRERMQRLELQLDPRRFVRIHRSAIVNWERVRELRHSGRGLELVLHGGTALRVARSHRDKLPRTGDGSA